MAYLSDMLRAGFDVLIADADIVFFGTERKRQEKETLVYLFAVFVVVVMFVIYIKVKDEKYAFIIYIFKK